MFGKFEKRLETNREGPRQKPREIGMKTNLEKVSKQTIAPTMKVSDDTRQMLTHTNYSDATEATQSATGKSIAANRITQEFGPEFVINDVHKPFFRRAFSFRHPFSFCGDHRASLTEEVETTSDEFSCSSSDALSEESASDDDTETSPARGGVSFQQEVTFIPIPSRKEVVCIARSDGCDGDTPGSAAEAVMTGRKALWWGREDYALFRDTSRVLARREAPDPSSDAEAHDVLLGGTTAARDNCEDDRCEVEHGRHSVDDEDERGWWREFGHSRRGIEHITHRGLGKQRLVAVEAVQRALLREQYRSKQYGKTAPATPAILERRLACVNMQRTGHAQDSAHRRGLRDAAAAAAVLGLRAPLRSCPP
mmetsp:Transcript_46460/g.90743  ORF Transcript_46460/g.90743 Transcript_46460/m.90743 type:complete len:366 (-) Transcript_46460:451-1548(-)